MAARSSTGAPRAGSSTQRADAGVGNLLWRLAAAAMLGLDAYVHVHDAGFYNAPRGGISQSTLFLLEAGAASVAAVVLIAGWRVPLGRRADWTGAFIVAVSALAAVLLYRYVDIGAIGPLPNMYKPTWEVPGKLLSAYAEGAAALLSALGLALPRSRSVPTPRVTPARNPSAADPTPP